ncbi:MAG: ATP-binding cassette domain-containing protein, partial [Chthoniobacterales bacterium]
DRMMPRAMNAPLLHCRDLQCMRPLWREGASHVRGVSAEFAAGRFHAISGAAGCGKNLLLHLLGLLEQPDDGEVWVNEINATTLSAAERDSLRLRTFGFLFPACALLPSLSVLENIAFPVLKAGGTTEAEQAEQTLSALQFCGLEEEAEQPVSQLAPERQAVAAFARAMIHRPPLLLAESPSAEEILVPLARRAVDELGLTVIWGARQDGPALKASDRQLQMVDGRIEAA